MEDCDENYVQKLLEFTIGNIFGKDITCREHVDQCDDYQPGALIDIGRTAVKLFKKFLLPGGLCGAVPAIKPVPPPPDKPVECSYEPNLIRPSQLPIYVQETSDSEETTWDETPPSFIEEGFGTVRRNIQSVLNDYEHVKDDFENKINTGIAHSQSLLELLREESNVLPRMGAVALSGLTGFILSLRGGRFKRLFYTSTGVSIMAAVCYPKETQEVLVESKHFINIGYNFIRGAKPGDEQQIAWPELKVPLSLQEFVDFAGSTASSVSLMIASLFETKSVESNENNQQEQKK